MPTVDDGYRFGIHFQRWASESSKTRVAVELIYLQGYFNDLIKSLLPYPRPTPSEEVTRVRLGVSIDATQ